MTDHYLGNNGKKIKFKKMKKSTTWLTPDHFDGLLGMSESESGIVQNST